MTYLNLINPYAFVMLIRRWLYWRGILRSYHPGIPVISIGNLSMGGSGKSPLVMEVAKYLIEQRGKRVAIVSRGYRRKSKGFVLVRDGTTTLADVASSGDEAQMFAELVPQAIVIVDEDRVRGATKAKDLGAEVVILDDGYQHLRIQRNLNILLFDSSRRLSTVIPLGRFREPLSTVRAADVVVFTRADDKQRVRSLWERLKSNLKSDFIAATLHTVADELKTIDGATNVELSSLKGKRVLAVSSIASPRRFSQMLDDTGAEVISRNLGDHADYSVSLVIAMLRDAERSGVEMLITTQKDAVKSRQFFLQAHPNIRILVLSLKIEFLSGEQSFYAAIDRLL